jgi:hypothetical protein
MGKPQKRFLGSLGRPLVVVCGLEFGKMKPPSEISIFKRYVVLCNTYRGREVWKEHRAKKGESYNWRVGSFI